MSYNGYPSYNAWNVSLWLSSDERLYTLMLDIVKKTRRHTGSKRAAPKALLEFLNEYDITHTPDGAKYTVSNIKQAMEGL